MTTIATIATRRAKACKKKKLTGQSIFLFLWLAAAVEAAAAAAAGLLPVAFLAISSASLRAAICVRGTPLTERGFLGKNMLKVMIDI